MDPLGYGGYGSTSGQPSQPVAAPVGSSQGPVGSSMMMMGPGSAGPGYPHQLQGHPSSRYHLGNDPSKGMTSQYPYGALPAASQPSQLMPGRPGQYGTDPRGYPDYPSHLSLSGPQSSSVPPSPGYPSRGIAPYPDQRLTGPPSRPPVHPMASHPGYSGYPGSSQGYPGSSSDIWGPSQPMPPHLQARGPYPGYPGPSSGSRGPFPVGQGDQYGTMAGRPTYFPGPTSQGPPPSVGGHIPSDSAYSQPSSAFNSSGRSSSSSGQQRQQSQYSAFSSGPLQPPPATSTPNVRYQQYYGTAPTSTYPDVSSQSRLSSYAPNSPGYRPPYPGPSSSQMSPRRPTPTPPSGSPMPPTSRTPDRVGTSGSSVSQSQSGFSSSSLQTGPSTTSSSSGGPSNSLAQLEQMVGGNSMATSGIKNSSQAAASPAGNNYYSQQQMSGPSLNSSQSSSYFPPPSSAPLHPSSIPPPHPNPYYSSYPSPIQGGPASGSWPGSQPSPSSGPNSGNTTLSGPGNGASSVSFSSSPQQATIKSPQQQSHPGTSPAGPSNLNSSSIKSPMTSGQFGMYDSSFNSPASTSDQTQGNHTHSNSISKPNQYETTSFGSPMTPKSKSDDPKIESNNKANKDERKSASDYPSQESNQTQSSPGFFGIRSGSTENSSSSMSPASQPSAVQDSYLPRQQPSFDPQSQTYMNQPYPQTATHQSSSSFNPQPIGQFPNSYGETSMNYEMQGMSSYSSSSEPRMYDSNYGNSSMDNMGGSMGEYSGEMSGYGTGPSPYDEPFSSEPPGPKRKGKGRPKKDPLEPKAPKEPKKPRQPRAPRGSSRGRGRGAKVNQGDRMPMPESGDIYGDSPYSISGEMYGAIHPMSLPPPGSMPHQGPPIIHGQPPIGHPPVDTYQSSIMPPNEIHPLHPDVSHPSILPLGSSNHQPDYADGVSLIDPPGDQVTESLPPPPQIEKSDLPSEPASESQQTLESQSQLSQRQPESATVTIGQDCCKSPEISTSERDVTVPMAVDQVSSESECSDPTKKLTLELSDGLEETKSDPQLIFGIPSDQDVVPKEEPLNVEEKTPTCELETADDQSSEPVLTKKKVGKKRKVKTEVIPEDSDLVVAEKLAKEKKPPKEKRPPKEKKATAPKKPKKKKGVSEELVDVNTDLDQSQLLSDTANDSMVVPSATDMDSTVASGLDDATQEDGEEGSQLDSSISDSPIKGKGKGKGKGTPKGPKKPKLKDGSGGKRKLPKIALAKFKGRKKKRLGSDDNASDIEKTPPPSPDEAESGVLKRRSGRLTKRTKYLDEVDIDLSGDEQKMKEDVPVAAMAIDDTMVVEKIMVSRMGTRELEPENEEEEVKFKADGKAPTVEVEEFYVKYKNLSYLHCDWRTEEELEKGDKRINQKIKRFKQKKDQNVTDFLDDEPFNPDYCEVDRILDVNIIEDVIPDPPKEKNTDKAVVENVVEVNAVKKEGNDEMESREKMERDNDAEENLKCPTGDSVTSETEVEGKSDGPHESQKAAIKEEGEQLGEKSDGAEAQKPTEVAGAVEVERVIPKRIVRHYLVKWQALSYEECTWELEDDLDPQKVANFWKFRELPSKDKMRVKKRPKATDWKQLPESPVYKNGNTLREYQLEGLNWLTFCWYNGRNCILADEMGLGKTIQSLTFINEMVKFGIHSPFLVIAPLSTIGNWQREFETWTDLNVITYHGSSASRNMLQEYEMFYKNEKGERVENIYKFQVMITTFEVVLTDCLELREIWWRCCVIDEAHRLKNRNCKLLEGLRLLNIEHRVLLTGTPLQNNVEELFSLLNFLEPTQFASSESFMLEFGDLKTEEQVDKLKAILKPMMLRRLKEDVEKSLAPKEETIVEVELTNIQKKYYRAIMERNFQFLSKGGTYANLPNLMNIVMELRKCCIHPFLINSAEEQITHDYRQQHGEDPDAQLKCMVEASGKLVLIDKLLPRLKADGHRVLIFSQMVRCLDILEDYVVHKKYPYERIDGRVRGNLRQAAIDRYSKPGSDRFVFLLCTRAGGLGINLTAADTVIIFDSDWNPQNDLQAQARCHRIGQSKAVKIYRLICRNTYEREMFDRASLKLGLDKAVLQSMNTGQKMDGPMSKKEVEELLRKGAYGAVMDDDNAGDKFCEEDIEQILLRRTQVITIENTEAKGSTFSKATFAASENRDDIDINDPNFWEKWAKKANVDSEEIIGKNELIVEEPRRRTQTRRFGQDDGLMEISEADSSDDDEDGISGRTRRGGRGRLGRDKKGKKGRGRYDGDRDEDYAQEFGVGNWTKSECFKIEKGLMIYGFGRWEQILKTANFKRPLQPSDVEDVARTILLFSLQNYRGDEKVKSCIWELISPPDVTNGEGADVSSPTSGKGRRSKKAKKTVAEELTTADWTLSDKWNPDINLNDESVRKHLTRQANRTLLRIKSLSYLKSDVIGEFCDDIDRGVSATDIRIPPISAEGEPPASWWDEECDKSLLVGVFKHGFDHYNLMRQDPNLCFLSRCGPPDGAALLAEIQDDDLTKLEEDDESEIAATPDVPKECSSNIETPSESVAEVLTFPSKADLNQRFRRLLTAHQRQFRRQEIRMAQQARHQQRLEKLEKFEAQIKERESKKREQAQKKWSRREESDFFRVVSSYGVEFDRKTKQFNWDKFKTLSRLEKKVDETISEYYKAFYAMCKRVTGKPLTTEEETLLISVDPVTEDRAARCLARIDLLSKIREDIVLASDLDEKLTLCQSSIDLPDWWISGKHDKDLLIGAAKYGLNRLDLNLMHDPDLSFNDVLKQAEEEAAALMKVEAEALERDNIMKQDVKQVLADLVDEVVKNSSTEIVLCKSEHPDAATLPTCGQAIENGFSEGAEETDLLNGVIRPNIEVNGNTAGDNIKMEDQEGHPKENKPATENPALTVPVAGPNAAPQARALRWPKDRVLQMRLEQLVYLFEKNEWPSVRHQFFTNLGPPVSTTPSVMTAESSPRAMSPGSLSSMSREPTPHPTPDNTPRRDAVSPLLECLFTEPETGERKRKRRRRRYDTPPSVAASVIPDQLMPDRQSSKLTPEQIARFSDKGFAAKLRNLLSQNIDQQVSQAQTQNFLRQSTDQQTTSTSSKRSSSSQSLLNQTSGFMSPLFANLPFMNLREDIRNELLGNEKTASLLLGSLSSRMQQQAQHSFKQSLGHNSSSGSSGHGSNGPPPAHQSSSKHRGAQMDMFDLSRLKGIAPPSPAHKTPKLPPPPPPPLPKVAQSVLDLSGGLPTKRSTRNSSSSSSAHPTTQPQVSLVEKSRKRIGSRIDALALNLQAKKMMEEKVDPNEPNILSEIAQKSEKRRSTRESSLDMLLGSRSSRSSSHQSSTPPAAHSSSSHSSSQSKIDSFNDALFGRSSTGRSSSHSSALSNMLDSTKVLPGQVPKVDQAAALQSYKSLSQDLKKWLEDHPEFVAANPSLAAAAAAAMALNPPASTSSMPANTELLELPEGRRRGRRPKNDSAMESPGVLGEETVSVINRLTGPKAPPLKYLQEWLEKNPNYDVDPKWAPIPRERIFDFKTPSAVPSLVDRSQGLTGSAGTRTRTSDRSARSSSAKDDMSGSSSSGTASSSSRRTTAASLLAQAHSTQGGSSASKPDRSSSSSSERSGNSGLGFSPSSLNPMNAFNPNLLASLSPSMKMFMDQAAAAAAASNSTSSAKTSSSNTSSSTTTSSASNMNSSLNPFGFPFGGLANMNIPNSLFGFPGFNIPGFGSGQIPGFPGADGESKKGSKEGSSSDRSSSRSSEKSSSREKSGRDKSSNASTGSSSMSSAERNAAAAAASLFGSAGSLPYMYPNPNFMFPGLNLSGLSMPGSSSPFASLAQSGLMNGLAGLGSSPSSSKHGSKDKGNKSSKSSSGAPSGLSLSTASSLLSSTGLHPSSAAAAAAMGDSDDESLKSLMGHDDEEDLNGDMEEPPEKDDDSDYELGSRKKSRSTRNRDRERSSRKSASNSKSKT